jgi:hypothetical protein
MGKFQRRAAIAAARVPWDIEEFEVKTQGARLLLGHNYQSLVRNSTTAFRARRCLTQASTSAFPARDQKLAATEPLN